MKDALTRLHDESGRALDLIDRLAAAGLLTERGLAVEVALGAPSAGAQEAQERGEALGGTSPSTPPCETAH